jgi:hypothetical protein
MPIDFYRWDNIATNTLLYPKLLHSPPRHSHSILSMQRNALIYKRKIFLLTVETRPSSRQNFSLLISKEKSRDSNSVRFRRLSTTIGQFFASSIAERLLRQDEKRPSASIAQAFALDMFVSF